MAGYIGSKAAVTQADGYTKSEADARYVEGDDTFVVDQTNNRVSVTGSDYQLKISDGSNQPYYIRHASDNSLRFHLNGTGDRVTIDGSGNLLVSTTSTFDATDNSNGSDDRFGFIGGRLDVERNDSAVAAFKRSGGNGTIMHFARGGAGVVGYIGVTTSSTSYNTSSDYRLKENVVDVTDGITRVKQLAPKRFNFIVDADTTVDGFLAHEAQAVVPESVTGTHNEVDADGNAVMQGIDQAKLVPLLTAALKEAIAKIETLETKVAALEAG